MAEDTTPQAQLQATEQERTASAVPQTAEEIAALLEALARNQADRDLAQRLRDWSRAVEQLAQYRLRDWSRAVEQLAQYRLRADAASIQSELYKTLEGHLDDIRRGADAIRATLAQRLDDLEQRIAALERSARDG